MEQYKIDNAASAMKTAFSKFLLRWAANKNAPNMQEIGGRKKNVPHVLFQDKVLLTKSKGKKKEILFNGKPSNEYKPSDKLLLAFAKTHTKFSDLYNWEALTTAYYKLFAD